MYYSNSRCLSFERVAGLGWGYWIPSNAWAKCRSKRSSNSNHNNRIRIVRSWPALNSQLFSVLAPQISWVNNPCLHVFTHNIPLTTHKMLMRKNFLQSAVHVASISFLTVSTVSKQLFPHSYICLGENFPISPRPSLTKRIRSGKYKPCFKPRNTPEKSYLPFHLADISIFLVFASTISSHWQV